MSVRNIHLVGDTLFFYSQLVFTNALSSFWRLREILLLAVTRFISTLILIGCTGMLYFTGSTEVTFTLSEAVEAIGMGKYQILLILMAGFVNVIIFTMTSISIDLTSIHLLWCSSYKLNAVFEFSDVRFTRALAAFHTSPNNPLFVAFVILGGGLDYHSKKLFVMFEKTVHFLLLNMREEKLVQ